MKKSHGPVVPGEDPTSVNATVRRMLWHYPTLYKNRLQCLEELFTGYGNGYEWVNGCLVNKFGYPTRDDDTVYEDVGAKVREAKSRHRAEDAAEYVAAARKHAKLYNWQLRFVRENIDDLVLSSLYDKLEFWYHEPSENYSPIFTIPEDVTRDWLDAAIEYLHHVWNDQGKPFDATRATPKKILRAADRAYARMAKTCKAFDPKWAKTRADMQRRFRRLTKSIVADIIAREKAEYAKDGSGETARAFNAGRSI